MEEDQSGAVTSSSLADVPVLDDAEAIKSLPAEKCCGGSLSDDEIWLTDCDEEADEAFYLNREGRKRHEEFYNVGYRDGLSAGKNDAAQDGFNLGFKDSVMIGYRWGISRGVTSALAHIPDELKLKLVETEERRREFQNLYEAVDSIGTEDALKMFNDDIQRGRKLFSLMAGQRNNYSKRAHSLDRSENGRNKRRSSGEDAFSIGTDDTIYRYLCPATKIGSIIGRGGEIVKQLRVDTKSKVRIGETVPGCDERVVTIYSASDETNAFDDMETQVCPAQDALFRVHDRVIAEDPVADDEPEGNQHVIARLLVPSDQIGCIIGKGGQIVQTIRSETGAQIRILKDDHLPACALSSDELLQISGEASIVRKALFQIASRLHDNPSRSQHTLASAVPAGLYPSAGSVIGAHGGAPIFAPIVGSYGGYKNERGDWPHSGYSSSREDSSTKDFSIRFVCPTANIGGVIGKGGSIINQIRQETRASIKVDSSSAEGDDCLITISSKEYFEDQVSPAIEAARRMQPRCSEKIERDSGIIAFTTRLLVPTSRIGCLIGRGGAIITEMRNITKANIRILSKDDLPKVAADDEEMVQISGDLDVAETALIHIVSRLRANLFEKEGQVVLPVLPYVPLSADDHDSMPFEGRDSKRHGRGLSSYTGGYGGSNDLPPVDHYGSYAGVQSTSGGSNYGIYGSGYSSGRSSSGLSGHTTGSRRRSSYY